MTKRDGMTKAQRMAYIDTSRRCQSLPELERKARKAKRRRPHTTREETDADFARDYRLRSRFFAHDNPELAIWNTHYCRLCSQFGTRWDEASKSYREPVRHAPRCSMHPADDGPYPGWNAALRARAQSEAEFRSEKYGA